MIIMRDFQTVLKNIRTITTKLPEDKSGLYNVFSMYPPKTGLFCHEIGLLINYSTKNPSTSKPLSLKYFNKPTIQYKPPIKSNNLIKYKPYPHDIKNLPLAMRGFKQPE